MAHITPMPATKAGKIRWKVRIRQAGKAERNATFDSYEEATAWADAAETQEALPTSLLEQVRADELVERYTDTVDENKAAFEEFAASPLAELYISEITANVVADLAESWIAATPRRIPAPLILLRDAWDSLHREFPSLMIPENPVTALKLTKLPAKDRRLSKHEEAVIRDSVKATRGGYLDQAITVALETALLQKNIVSLDWNNVDFTRREISIDGKIIPMSDSLYAALKSLNPKSNGKVFGDLSAMALHRSFSRRLEKLGINDLTFNDLRTEAIYRLFEQGMSLEQVRKIVGNKTDDALLRIESAVRGNELNQ